MKKLSCPKPLLEKLLSGEAILNGDELKKLGRLVPLLDVQRVYRVRLKQRPSRIRVKRKHVILIF